MDTRYKTAIKTYFSDYVSWLLIVSFLFVVSFASFVIFNGVNPFIWIIPVCFVIIYLLCIPFLFLYLKVKKDIKECNIEKLSIRIKEIKDDKNFNFKNRGGAAVGKHKYKIIDEANNDYLISASNDKDFFIGFYPAPNFALEIEYLKKSRLVLRMNIIDGSKTDKGAREQQDNIKHFKKTFSHYF
ncbi:MAG: hypothetical protein ACI4E0_14555 [Blautia sp.]